MTDLNELLPDCGYKLRSVEIQAEGELVERACEDCVDDETRTVLAVTGGGIEFELAGEEEPIAGPVRLVGTVQPPFEGHQRVQVQSITPLAKRP